MKSLHDNVQDSAIRAAMERIAEEFIDYWEVYSADVEEIPHDSYDGFVPFTNGGFRIMAMSDLGQAYNCGLTGRESDILQPYIDRAEIDAAESFIDDHTELAEQFEARVNVEQSAVDWLYDLWAGAEEVFERQGQLLSLKLWWAPQEAQREEFWDYLNECLSDGGEFWYQVGAHYFAPDNRRNVSGQPEVYFFAGINTDFTYGRDSGIESTYERSLKISEITPEVMVEIERDILASFTA